MSAVENDRITVTVRTRQGQVLEMDLATDAAVDVHHALLQMIGALFDFDPSGQVRSVTFEIDRRR